MAVIKWDDNSEYYVPDAILESGDVTAAWTAAVPIAKYQAQQRLMVLMDQLNNFIEPTEFDLLQYARETHHAYLARHQISEQISIVEQELAQWP